jgi:hypothetical protein
VDKFIVVSKDVEGQGADSGGHYSEHSNGKDYVSPEAEKEFYDKPADKDSEYKEPIDVDGPRSMTIQEAREQSKREMKRYRNSRRRGA